MLKGGFNMIKKNTKVSEKNRDKKDSQRGMSIIETLPLILIFTTLVGFTFGFYGIIQRHSLNHIAARAYGFELIRHRSNITYFRDVAGASGNQYHLTQSRWFTSVSDKQPETNDDGFYSKSLQVRFPNSSTSIITSSEVQHNENIYNQIKPGQQNISLNFNRVWVQVGYGICLTASCGDN